jgi:hypothetical protein
MRTQRPEGRPFGARLAEPRLHVVNELVELLNQVDSTRADLREFNEANFMRFDAKIEQRSAELKAFVERSLKEQTRFFYTGLGDSACDHRAVVQVALGTVLNPRTTHGHCGMPTLKPRPVPRPGTSSWGECFTRLR